MSRPTLAGVIAAVPTPIDATGAPNVPALLSFCERLLDSGCHGINLLGTTGEATSLGMQTRTHLMTEVARAQLSHRMMVGTGCNSLSDTITLTRHAQECGFQGALLLPPFYYPDAPEEALFTFFSLLAQATKPKHCGLYLYNIPQNTGVTFKASLVARLLAEHPGAFKGLKDSSGDLAYATSLAQQFPALDVFPSNEATLSESHARGFAGCISASVNVAPSFAREIYDRQRNDLPSYAIMNSLRQKLAVRGLVPSVKLAVSLLQHDSDWKRLMPPLGALTAAQEDELRADLLAAGVINA